MFAKACAMAKDFTRPLIVFTRKENGDIGTSVGSCVILNDEGWVTRQRPRELRVFYGLRVPGSARTLSHSRGLA